MACVYGLCRQSDSTIRYVGWTSQSVRARFSAHRTAAKRGDEKPLYQWMREHVDVTFVVLHDSVSNDKAKRLEVTEIASRDNLLNLSKGGEGSPGYRHTTEALMKISLSAKNQARSRGRKHAVETRALMSSKAKERMTDAERHRLANLRKGVKSSQEHRAKQSEAMRGKSPALKGKRQPVVTCNHCGKSGGNTMGRWHFDNCKLKENKN